MRKQKILSASIITLVIVFIFSISISGRNTKSTIKKNYSDSINFYLQKRANFAVKNGDNHTSWNSDSALFYDKKSDYFEFLQIIENIKFCNKQY